MVPALRGRRRRAADKRHAAADPLSVQLNHSQLEVRRNLFCVRVDRNWNAISHELRAASTASNFKISHRYALYRKEIIH
jgi:hypothetical protein